MLFVVADLDITLAALGYLNCEPVVDGLVEIQSSREAAHVSGATASSVHQFRNRNPLLG